MLSASSLCGMGDWLMNTISSYHPDHQMDDDDYLVGSFPFFHSFYNYFLSPK